MACHCFYLAHTSARSRRFPYTAQRTAYKRATAATSEACGGVSLWCPPRSRVSRAHTRLSHEPTHTHTDTRHRVGARMGHHVQHGPCGTCTCTCACTLHMLCNVCACTLHMCMCMTRCHVVVCMCCVVRACCIGVSMCMCPCCDANSLMELTPAPTLTGAIPVVPQARAFVRVQSMFDDQR